MIKDIAVHLTGSSEDTVRIAYSAALARKLDAQLTGLYMHQLPSNLVIADASAAALSQQLVEQSMEHGRAAVEALEERFGGLGLNYQLRRIDAYPGQIGRLLAKEARQSDLFVGTRPYGAPYREQWIEEAVLFESGRPCLFIPPSYRGDAACRNILVAWKNTREAARAVADAVPLLRKASSVVVGIVDGSSAEERVSAPDEDIGRYLSRHDVRAEMHVIQGWSSVSEAILNEAVRTAADLVVMGAYGHSRFREWAMGGATRDILSTATVPVLVAH